MNDFKAKAINQLSEFFSEELINSKCSLRDFEEFVSTEGMKILCNAMGLALERLDNELFIHHQSSLRVKEKRTRTLASTVGDLEYSRRIYVDVYGNSYPMLDEVLDVGFRSKISPRAFEFLVKMASKVSYQESSNILTSAGGSAISANTVMRAIHRVGENCKCEDEKLAYSLYLNGVVPEGTSKVKELFVESDGTYVSLQDGKKVEIKAMVAYAGKEGENRIKRINACHFGCIGNKTAFWTQAVSAVAENFDLAEVKKVHMGFDGDPTYKNAGGYFLISAEFDGNLDPFHVNRAVGYCFKDDEDARKQVMSCLWYKNPLDAADMVESYAEAGVIKKERAEELSRYIRNNAEFIKKNDFTLGTMECEQEHMYKSRMASVPCAWSVKGADAIARIRSRLHSGRDLVFLTRKDTISEKRMEMREKKICEFFEKQPLVYQKTTGKGYNYPYQAHLNQKIKSGLVNAWSYCRKKSEVPDPY